MPYPSQIDRESIVRTAVEMIEEDGAGALTLGKLAKTLGVRTPGFVEVRSGIDGNEQVVVGGQVRLQPGMPVTAIPVDRPPQRGGEEAAPGGEPGDSGEAVTPDSGL